MLAYVFWHHPRAGSERSRYESDLLGFHDLLKSAGSVVDSVTYRIAGVPWANGSKAAYEDWYLVDGWADLGALNAAAVSGSRKPPHDGVAREYAAGAGGLYELRSGRAAPADARSVQWLAKPRGLSYAAFDAMLEPALGEGGLWRRQMVLGPGTEFCVTGPRAAPLDATLEGLAVERSLLCRE